MNGKRVSRRTFCSVAVVCVFVYEKEREREKVSERKKHVCALNEKDPSCSLLPYFSFFIC
jgi:hypothetical protein